MSLIYVLQKDVPGLGLLTKIGMTTRSGEDRGKEYGGGGWVCIKEYPVTVDDPSELRKYEKRIHERLESVKCKEAEGFGLTEVFKCSSDIVGNEPSLDEEVQRLRQKISKGVVSRLRKQYEAKYAKLSKEGGGSFIDYTRGDMRKYRGMSGDAIGRFHFYDEFLRTLNSSGEDDPVFRALLESERKQAKDVLDMLQKNRDKRT